MAIQGKRDKKRTEREKERERRRVDYFGTQSNRKGTIHKWCQLLGWNTCISSSLSLLSPCVHCIYVCILCVQESYEHRRLAWWVFYTHFICFCFFCLYLNTRWIWIIHHCSFGVLSVLHTNRAEQEASFSEFGIPNHELRWTQNCHIPKVLYTSQWWYFCLGFDTRYSLIGNYCLKFCCLRIL